MSALANIDQTETALTIVKEMGITHADFFRTIPQALGSREYVRLDDGVVLQTAGRRLQITIGPQGERRIARLSVPRTRVTLMFSGYEEAEVEAAVKRFDMMFKKGGG